MRDNYPAPTSATVRDSESEIRPEEVALGYNKLPYSEAFAEASGAVNFRDERTRPAREQLLADNSVIEGSLAVLEANPNGSFYFDGGLTLRLVDSETPSYIEPITGEQAYVRLEKAVRNAEDAQASIGSREYEA